jgi:hypothetical protein
MWKLREKLTGGARHRRIESQEDVTALADLSASPYDNPFAAESQDYFDRRRRHSLHLTESSQTPGDGDAYGDDQPLTGPPTAFHRGVHDEYVSPPVTSSLPPLKEKQKSKPKWKILGKAAFCIVAFLIYVYLYPLSGA